MSEPAAGFTAWRLVLPSSLGPVDQDPDEVRQDACELLSPEVTCEPPDLRPQQPRTSSSGGLSGIVWLLLAVGVALLIGLAVRAIAGRVRDRDVDDDEVEPGDGAEIVPLDEALIDPDNSPGDWRARSQRHRAAGEHRDALRCEYRALVGDLARRNLLDEIPGRTTGEERAQLRRTAPVVNDAFGAAADMFDVVWYGAADATAEMVERFDRLEQEVLAATAKARRPVTVT
jgi:Domain of unknown function (DUF4129)